MKVMVLLLTQKKKSDTQKQISQIKMMLIKRITKEQYEKNKIKIGFVL